MSRLNRWNHYGNAQAWKQRVIGQMRQEMLPARKQEWPERDSHAVPR